MLEDKTIIITGASSGIGKSIAISLSKLGAKCVLIGRDLERLKEVQVLCENKTLIISENLCDFDAYDGIVEKVFREFGPIYGFVHSAGIEQTILLQQLTHRHMSDIFEINVFSPVEFLKRLIKKKYRDEKQSFVLISSVMGVVGNKGLTSYSASKGAIIAMVKSMALELSGKGVRINAVSPGHVKDSEMSIAKELKLSVEANEKIEQQHPLGLGTCEDVAQAVSFLLSDGAKWITGQNLIIDGGYTIQ
ncbi:SDR family NAD(P)-dependent oxidoreductase [Flavobacterium sp. GCM10023249]|uniref:SDR family NAD(P)-dependent oxidoreductase n=1 Tax=unclassified Flavobacterium TaxID=196869 RepID=UPI00361BF5DD